MTGPPQHIEIFVTHVAEDGPLLKIWGQPDRSAATFIERLILQYTEQFERGVGVPLTTAVSLDQLCCAKYGDGGYYRAKISDVSAVQQGYVGLTFIDYGNSDIVPIKKIRLLQHFTSSPLCSIQSQATEFILAGVVPLLGASWDQNAVEFVRKKLCYAEFRCAIVAQIAGQRLITLHYNNLDFSDILIKENLAIRLPFNAHQAMFHNLQYQYSNTPTYPTYSMPPPAPVQCAYSPNTNLLTLAKPTNVAKQELGIISAPVLRVGSKHVIYISNVEDGPHLFAVQLKNTEGILQNMTQTFSQIALKSFSQSPIPGSLCVSLLPQAKVWCRAVVTNIMEKECVVYCVDFGNTETVPFDQIYEMPSQFLNTKSLAMRFCLAGIQNTKFDDETKRLFQKLVTGETLTLEVVEPEGPPLKQYGNLFLNNQNLVSILKEQLKQKERSKSYPPLPELQPGKIVYVTVSYVDSVDNFYVQYEANAKALTKIMSTMLDYCTNSAATLSTQELYVGMPVCALFSADQQWYRAKILSIEGDNVTVFYVDYGNTDVVNLISLRDMDPNLALAQAQAITCCLSGFEAASASVDDLSNRLEEMTLEKKVAMKIISKLSNRKFVVELHDTSVAPVVNIGLHLMSPPTKSFEETPIDEWHDPAAVEPATVQSSSRQFGKDRSRQEDGNGDDWKGDGSRGGRWNESRDTSKKWGSQDENRNRNDRKWNKDDRREEPRKWGKVNNEDDENFRDNRNRSGDNRNTEKHWDRRAPSNDSGNWREREKRGFNQGDDEWRESSTRRGFGKGNEDRAERDNRKPFYKDNEDWKNRDDKGRYNRDAEDKSWKRQEEQSQDGKKWWAHDDRNKSERKWSSNETQDGGRRDYRNDGDDRRKGGYDNKGPNGDYKKFNNGDRGNRMNFEKDNSNEGTKPEGDWDAEETTQAAGDGNWNTGTSDVKTNVKAFTDVAVKFGLKNKVLLVFADDPTNFFVQLNEKVSDLTNMMDDIASLYESGGSVVPETNQKVSYPCVARYSEDNAWYRAVIISASSEGTTEVRFVDYGNHEYVPSAEVKEVEPQFFSFPLFGIPCTLYAVNVPITEWSSEQVTEFLNLADGKELEAYFIKKEGPLYEVILYDVDETNVSINEKFGAPKKNIEEGKSKKDFKSSSHSSHISEQEIVYASLEDKYATYENTLGTSERISVTWFVSPEQFYCQRNATNSEFATMVNEIQTVYKKRETFKGKLDVGMPIIARFLNDKVLYRAEVVEIKDSKYQVQYIDYGNKDLVLPNNIWKIEKRFMDLPKQGIECSLKDIKPVEQEWQKDSKEFDRLFGVDNLECTFHDVENGRQVVSLNVNGKDLAEELVSCGLARKVEKSEEYAVVSEEPLALNLLKGQQITAHVSFIESLSKFYVHLDPVVAKNIQSQVDKYVLENKNPAPILPAELIDHHLCLASPDGKQWYRGKIIDTTGTVGVCVNFVDFGDSDDIPADRICSIPESLIGFRHQATECFVAGSNENEANKEIEETFKLEVEAQDVILFIEDVINERLSVHLFDVEGQRLELLKNVDKASPLDVDPLSPLPILTRTVQMCVSWVENINEIWLQKDSDMDMMTGLLDLLFHFYEEEAKGVELGDPQPGQLCAAKSIKDGNWYRSYVYEINDDDINVRFIDYGNMENVSRDNVKELDPSFYHVHALALCASLAATIKDPEKVVEEFLKVTSDIVFDVSFVKDSEGKWVIHLENNDLNVIHHLAMIDLLSEREDLFQISQVKLPINEKIDVNISHFESCSTLWVQMDSNLLDILELQQTLQTISPEQASLASKTVGMLCIAQFCDGAWYRAKILACDGTKSEVLFLDYGNTYKTEADLKKLPIKCFRWPYFAVVCCLADESFKNEKLAEVCSEILSDSESVFQLQVVDDSNDPVSVSLFVGEKDLEKVFLEKREEKDNAVKNSTKENLPSDVLSNSIETQSGAKREEKDNAVTNSTKENLPSDVLSNSIETQSGAEIECVYVSHVSSPAKFWIQKESASSDLQWLADALIEAENFEPVSDVEVGHKYAALFEDDEQWYRAQVLELCESNYNVLFVDYGNTSVVSDLRVLPEALENKPSLAKCCHLYKPEGAQCWSAEADQKFVEMSAEGTEMFEMIVLSTEEPYEVKLIQNGNDVSSILSKLCISYANIPSGEQFPATISHLNGIGEFWLHWESDSTTLESVSERLIEAENFDPVQEFSDGLLCVAQFPDDDQWYRARILSCQEESIEVFFIDYGNSSLVTEVHCIPQDLSSIPPLAKRCMLPLPNSLEKWTDAAEEEFIKIFGDGSNIFQVKIDKDGDPAVVNLELNGNQVLDVLLNTCTVQTENNTHEDKTISGSSSEVEILSVTEVTLDNENTVDIKDINLSQGLSISKCESQGDISDDAKMKLEVSKENSEESCAMSLQTNDVQVSDTFDKTELDMHSENTRHKDGTSSSSSTEVVFVSEVLVDKENSVKIEDVNISDESSFSKSDAQGNITDVANPILEETVERSVSHCSETSQNNETKEICEGQSASPSQSLCMEFKEKELPQDEKTVCDDYVSVESIEPVVDVNEQVKIALDCEDSIKTETVSRTEEVKVTEGTEECESFSFRTAIQKTDISLKKSNVPLCVEHNEHILKDFSVEMQISSKKEITTEDDNVEKDVVNTKQLGNMSNSQSPSDTSEKQSQSHLYANETNVVDDTSEETCERITEVRNNGNINKSNENIHGDMGDDEERKQLTVLLPEHPETSGNSTQFEECSTVLERNNDASPFLVNIKSKNNEIPNHPSDTSDSNSVSVTSSSSLQKDSGSSELDSEMSGDVSGSLYEDSDSSANSTVISSKFLSSAKSMDVDDKMKYYEFAQIHTDEEIYESIQSGFKSTSTSQVDTLDMKAASSKPDLLVEEEKD